MRRGERVTEREIWDGIKGTGKRETDRERGMKGKRNRETERGKCKEGTGVREWERGKGKEREEKGKIVRERGNCYGKWKTKYRGNEAGGKEERGRKRWKETEGNGKMEM